MPLAVAVANQHLLGKAIVLPTRMLVPRQAQMPLVAAAIQQDLVGK